MFKTYYIFSHKMDSDYISKKIIRPHNFEQELILQKTVL